MNINISRNLDGTPKGTYLGTFSGEELEIFKRLMIDPSFTDRMGIRLTYIAPLKKIDDNDSLQQFVIFPSDFNFDGDGKKGPRIRI